MLYAIASIALFALGYAAAELSKVPALIVAAASFALIVGLVVVNNRKRGAK